LVRILEAQLQSQQQLSHQLKIPFLLHTCMQPLKPHAFSTSVTPDGTHIIMDGFMKRFGI